MTKTIREKCEEFYPTLIGHMVTPQLEDEDVSRLERFATQLVREARDEELGELEELLDAAQDFFDGTEEDRGHEPEWKALSLVLQRLALKSGQGEGGR